MKQDYEQLDVFQIKIFNILFVIDCFQWLKKLVHKFRFVQMKIFSNSEEFIGNQSICNKLFKISQWCSDRAQQMKATLLTDFCDFKIKWTTLHI